MEEGVVRRPLSGPDKKKKRRPKTSPGGGREFGPPTAEDGQDRVGHQRPTTAVYRSHGRERSILRDDSIQEVLPRIIEVAGKGQSISAAVSSDSLYAGDSILSLPVLRNEPVSTVTLLDDDGGVTEQEQLDTPAHLRQQTVEDVNKSLEYTVDYDKIHNLLYLTEGETDFDSDKEIPDIFAQVEQLEDYSAIKKFKEQIEEEQMKPYMHEFTGEMQDESLLVGKVSREQIEEEDKQLQLEHMAYQDQEATKQQERQKKIADSKEAAKKEVNKTVRKRRRTLRKKEAQVVQSSMVHHKQLYNAFNTAQKQMITALNARKAEVKTLYGDLQRADGYYGAVKGRRWKVDWTKAPQPVQIKIKTLRGIRDKLPASRYVLLVSLYDRLGGHVLRWSRMKGQQWAASTVPVDHQGHYYNTDIKLDQSIYTALPSKASVRPSMVLVFELFVLRGAATPTDRVVGWGVFPICDAEFRIIEGKYKCPFLRGSLDPQITKHSQIEKLMASDLENWLCNLYFEVIKLPRYLSGMHEYEVELQFSSTLLGHPDRTHDERGVVDGNEPSYGSTNEILAGDGDMHELIGTPTSVPSTAGVEREAKRTSFALQNDHSVPGFTRTSISRGPLTSRLSRRLHSGHTGDSDTTSSSDEEEEVGVARDLGNHGDSGFLPVSDHPGMYYKVHEFNPLEEKQRRTMTMFPQTPVLQGVGRGRGQQRKRVLTEEEQLQQHSMAVKTPFSEHGKARRRMNERLQYVGRQFVSEFGLSQWRSLEFWSMVVILVLSWWIRLYLHYVAQYAFLRAARIPVNRFEFFPHTVVLNYQSSLLFTRETVAIIILGPILNTVIFCLLILLSWIFQRLFGNFPDLGSQFITAFGIQAFLDPYWIFLVDMALQRYQAPLPDSPTADATKLYWHFVRLEGSGVIGVFLLIFLYLFVSFLTLVCLYMFFLRVHMNGRLIDIYHRLKSPEEMFFLPLDMEVSNQELGYVCRKAEQWRGVEGERRKVAVHDYVWTYDESELHLKKRTKGEKQVTTHVSVHTLHLDGLRELFRHFLRLEQGNIIEVFGELSSVPGISAGLKNALVKHSRENESSSRQSSPLPIESKHSPIQQSTPVKHHKLHISQSPRQTLSDDTDTNSSLDSSTSSFHDGYHTLPNNDLQFTAEYSLNETTVIEVESSYHEETVELIETHPIVESSSLVSEVEETGDHGSDWRRETVAERKGRDDSKNFEKKLSAGQLV